MSPEARAYGQALDRLGLSVLEAGWLFGFIPARRNAGRGEPSLLAGTPRPDAAPWGQATRSPLQRSTDAESGCSYPVRVC